MKLVYTHENGFVVSNIKHLIEANNIGTFIKNEYAQGAIGEISVFDTWPELWITDDSDFELAMAIINTTIKQNDLPEWRCKRCKESNDASFDLCWHCQVEKD